MFACDPLCCGVSIKLWKSSASRGPRVGILCDVRTKRMGQRVAGGQGASQSIVVLWWSLRFRPLSCHFRPLDDVLHELVISFFSFCFYVWCHNASRGTICMLLNKRGPKSLRSPPFLPARASMKTYCLQVSRFCFLHKGEGRGGGGIKIFEM